MIKINRVVCIILVVLFTVTACTCSNLSTLSSPSKEVTEELRFYVNDETGRPLSGAKVVSQNSPENQLKVTGITDENGKVLFKGIKAGHYEFQISRFEYQPAEIDVDVSYHLDNTITVTLYKADSY